MFFQLKGGTGGTERALLSPCLFELFKFCREAVGFPPNIFKVTRFTSLIQSGVSGDSGSTRLTQLCSSSASCTSVRLRAHLLFCLYFDRILEDIPLKKRKKTKTKK